jgi:flagella basal body P-ring formation protein FlgA
VVSNRLTLFALIFWILAGSLHASAAQDISGEFTSEEISRTLSELVRQALKEKLPHADIRIPSLKKLVQRAPLSELQSIQKVRITEDRPNGTALFEVSGTSRGGNEQNHILQTPYEAWVNALIARRRINPNTKLKQEDFRQGEVNVASGPVREYRGVLVPVTQDVDKMQTKQTILENQYVVQNAVEKQPDIRRGETVKLELISGELTLSTQAMAEEPASIGDRIRVTTVKTKKLVVGTVQADRSVEVSL